MTDPQKIIALSGGVGGAKLSLGFDKTTSPIDLAIVANTGDDFEHLGLHVSPDIDTLIYTLAGVNNEESGWGRANETWSFMSALRDLGGETWFQLGDKDLALNVLRTQQLKSGNSLSVVTEAVATCFGIGASILPMTDDPVRTMIHTNSGLLAFQEYFVREQCRPAVTDISFNGIETAKPSPKFAELLSNASVSAFVICPSNPYLSIEPILRLPSVRDSLKSHPAPVIVVSPVIAGQSVKGPTSKIMREFGLACSSIEIARHYLDIADVIVIDHKDANSASEIEALGIRVCMSGIMMNSVEDKIRLANDVLGLIFECSRFD